MRNEAGSSTTAPFHANVPDAGTSPSTACNSVVLPEPTRPTTTVNEPAGSENETSSIPTVPSAHQNDRGATSSERSDGPPTTDGGGRSAGSGRCSRSESSPPRARGGRPRS